ncbi:MAG: DNA polymerase I [Chitinivibrionales bacterium]|nr:DNA polymerase I [Chitinivibrionales bacterium]
MEKKKNLYLIDGYALAYRAHYALIRTPLVNSKGQPTSAVFGFANYLLKLMQEPECEYLAVVFDSKKPSFRKELFAEYKMNRKPMPDELISQIPLIFQLVEKLNIPYTLKDGFEADDIIASIAHKAAAENFKVFIVTKDKDLMQLVGECVSVLAPESGGLFTLMGPQQVQQKMGVPPEKIVDLLALMGDSSDNIPGVPGVGEKTAVKLLESAGSVDAMLADISCISNAKLQQKIVENRQILELSKKLATLHPNTGEVYDLQQYNRRPLKITETIAFFKELEFFSLLKNPLLQSTQPIDFSVSVPDNLETVRTIASEIRNASFVSIDTETTSLQPHDAQLVGISLALTPTTAWYIPVGHDSGANLDIHQVLEVLRPILESPSIRKIGQNLKYDYQIFKRYNVSLRGIWFDTLIAAYLIDPGKRQYNLDLLAQQWLSMQTTPIESLIGKGKSQKSFATVPIEQASHYSGEDVVIPLRLLDLFTPILQERNLTELFQKVEIPLVTVLAEMEWQGVAIDTDLLRQMSREYSQRLESVSETIYVLAEQRFNLNSPKQISEVFFSKLNLPKSKKTKTGLSTDVDALEKLAPDYPIAKELLQYREIQKLLSTYIDSLPSQINSHTNRVHTSFNQTVAATGRLSSTDPNLQNIPIRTDDGRRIREAFVARQDHVLISADYSQIELRLLAHLSGDPRLIQAFTDDRDIHAETAAAMYGITLDAVTPPLRSSAKTINFGLMYGMGPLNLSRQLAISFREAQRFIELYFQQFPTIHAFMEECKQKAATRGYCETILGRRRYLPEINSDDVRLRESAQRVAINTPVQGTAADIIKMAMVTIQSELANRFPEAAMILQVHDELVFEVPSGQSQGCGSLIKELMSSAYHLTVPLKVDIGIGKTWSLAH